MIYENEIISVALMLWLSLFFLLILLYFAIKYYYYNVIDHVSRVVQPKFLRIDISPNAESIIQLAIDYWRLKEKIRDIERNGEVGERIATSLKRIDKFFKSQKIEVQDFKGYKYSPDIVAIEVRSIEPTTDKRKDTIIKDVIHPAVFLDGQLVKKAQVIVYKYENK